MVTVTLDRERTLVYTLAVINRLQEEHGISVFQLISTDDPWWLNSVTLSAVLWGGLITDDPTLTIPRVVEMFDLRRLFFIIRAVTEAIGDAFGEVMEGEQRANPPIPSPSLSP